MKRPFGVTVLAIIAILAGIIGLLGALGLFAGLGLFGSGAASIMGSGHGAVTGLLGLGLAVLLLVLSILYIVFGIGALELKRWAWGLGVALSILTVVDAGLTAAAKGSLDGNEGFTVIVAVLILVYLYTRHIRQAFGRK